MLKKTKQFLKEHWIFLLFLLIILLWFIYSYFTKGIVHSLIINDPEKLTAFVNSFGVFAWLVFVFIVILENVFAPIPPLVLYVAGGFLFGWFFGGVLTLLGNLIGALICFKIARTFGRDFVEKKVKTQIKMRFDKFSEKYGATAIFLLRLNPFTSTDLLSYLAGLTNMKLRKFLLATGMGLTPLIFVQTYLGEIFIDKSPLLSLILIIASAFYLLIFIYILLWSLKKKSS